MKAIFTYPVSTTLLFDEHWLLRKDDLELRWIVDGARVKAIAVTVPMTERDQPPRIQPGKAQGITYDINVGDHSRHDEIEQLLRTVQGFLALFSFIAIDFEHVELSWIAENGEEQPDLFAFSQVPQAPVHEIPRELAFDYAARAFFAAAAGFELEIPLSFLRRGRRDARDGRHIEAFYNLFFFLETLFAPGVSNPKKVKQLFMAASEIHGGLTEARKFFAEAPQRENVVLSLLAKSDEEIISHLVDLRGNLHHHALRRPNVWHPDKAAEFRSDVYLLEAVVQSIAMRKSLPLLFNDAQQFDLMQSVEAAGLLYTLRIEATEVVAGERRELPVFRMNGPGRRATRAIIDRAHQRFREHVREASGVELVEYRIMSEDGAEVFAIYQRHVTPSALEPGDAR